MSYPKSLDDYTSNQLRDELNRRDRMMRAGKCPYCEQPTKPEADHACKWAGNEAKFHQPVVVPEPSLLLNTETA